MIDNFYKKLIEDSLIGYAYCRIICDKKGAPIDYEFIEVNPAFEKLAGIIGAEIIGKKITTVLPDIKNNKIDLISFFGDVAINGGNKEFEYYSEPLKKWYNVNVYSPQKTYVIFYFMDISKQTLAIRESEKQFRGVVENSRDAFYRRNALSGTYEYVSPIIKKIVGYTQEEMVNMTVSELLDKIHSEDLPRLRTLIRGATQNDEVSYEFEYRFLCKDGNYRWLVDRSTLVKDEIGKPKYIFGTFQDVTEQKIAEAQLIEAKEYFELVYNISPDSSIITRLSDGLIINVNEVFIANNGYTREELIGNSSLALNLYANPSDRNLIVSELKAKGYCKNIETIFKRRDGTKFVGLMSSQTFNNGERYCFSSIRDITDLKIIEKKNIQANFLIQQTRNNFNSFFNTIKDMLFVLDTKGTILHINNTVCNRLEYTEEELIGKSILVVHPENRKNEVYQIVEDMLSLKIDLCLIPVITKSGKEIPVETRVVMGSWDGKNVLFGVVKDISELKMSEEKFAKAFHLSPVIMAISTMDDGLYIDVNAAFIETLGYSREDVIGKKSTELGLFADSRDRKKIMTEYQKNGKIQNIEILVKDKKGLIHNGIFSLGTISVGKKLCWLTTMIDDTDRKKAEEKLKESTEKYITIFDQSPIAIELYGSDGNLLAANTACLKLFGIKEISEISVYNLFKDLISTYDMKRQLLNNDSIRIETLFDFEIAKRDRNFKTTCSGIIELDCTITPLIIDNKTIGYIDQIQDITEQKNAEKEIRYLSYHDHLTGLYNRRFYEEALKRLDTKENLPLSIIMGDVNGLKLINDSFGHIIGDELLIKVANVIKNGCREGDIVARLGGDEFVMIFPRTQAEETEKIIKRIKSILLNEKINAVNISVSFGYQTKNILEKNIQEVLKETEDNMYKNKLFESLSLRSKTIDVIMDTLFEKSHREMLHSYRVSEICEVIATKMKLGKDSINQIRIAGLMHDIGKIAIDEAILNKPAKLNIEEFNEIKRHSEIGYRILSSANEFSEIATFILQHHERWDGKGYPKGLKGEEISLQARIICLADSYDAMTSDRPYKKGLSEEDAIIEIEKNTSSQFDPEIAKVFIESVLKSKI